MQNKSVIELQKTLAKLRRKIDIDNLYISAGFVVTLHKLGVDHDTIGMILEETDKEWNYMRDNKLNALEYCKELTGYEIITPQEALDRGLLDVTDEL